MVQLPVWELGLIILLPLMGAFALRGVLESKLVNGVAAIRRSVVQFRLELGLFTVAALVMSVILQVGYNFPLIQSGMKLVLGIVTVGLFAALDLAMARERIVINDALAGNAHFDPPRELSPLTRKFSLVATLILLLITGIFMLVIIRDIHWLAEQDLSMVTVGFVGRSVLIEILFVMGFLLLMVVNLVFSYARNLRMLFDNETMVLERVSRGDLTRKVPVTTSDELGVIAGHTNTMISALRDGVRMRDGLLIAQEVQQHFLPDAPPELPGLDIAGSANFSDETGGDFYDFIHCEIAECERLAIAVGDVSGHGIGAALLMAAGRALVRQSALTHEPPAGAIATANRHLARDIGDSGRFMTLFYMTIEPAGGDIAWVNAGHQPPLLYDASSDAFIELRGGDIPLGVEETWEFNEYRLPPLGPGQIVLIGTDGAWETHNEAGEMFGSTRLEALIRNHHEKPAREILDRIVAGVLDFGGNGTQEDDLTLVIIKGV